MKTLIEEVHGCLTGQTIHSKNERKLRHRMSVMANIGCQLDRLQTLLGHIALGMSVREFLDWVEVAEWVVPSHMAGIQD